MAAQTIIGNRVVVRRGVLTDSSEVWDLILRAGNEEIILETIMDSELAALGAGAQLASVLTEVQGSPTMVILGEEIFNPSSLISV